MLSVRARGVALTAAVLLAGSAKAAVTVVYDGSLAGGTQTINQQGWLEYVTPGGASHAAAGGVNTLNTTVLGQGGAGGYFSHVGFPSANVPVEPINAAWPTLNAAAGFTVRFDVGIASEAHNPDNQRAGFSVIVIGSGLRGVELGFWQDRVFAYEGGVANLFTPAEFASRDTAPITRYDLVALGSSYALFAGGDLSAPILSGALRDYTAFDSVAAGLPFNPYATGDFVFLGDNTGRGQSVSHTSYISLTDAAIPAPGAAGVLMVGVVVAGRRRRRAVYT